mmetsp:Transcript_60097/g.82331  ORF Transcript_60097/g.82331 Transcript_60097/m.82331 type:complete len:143 (-) Transcript_60097:379-807(-)|eukprot:CAMPEP_0185781376 /NCGR_PEP_ID=MMETSP1174-20130828/102179_1 /TAXON_ID=35687 /ORGANISM="Dictyocha speculum, Strain CCMP1381" /LENGTH=142 /DNA_ID=CAMNT_0028471329 /DNA_START=43 /DNA_END=471 /DNA_ORIENTATION=+
MLFQPVGRRFFSKLQTRRSNALNPFHLLSGLPSLMRNHKQGFYNIGISAVTFVLAGQLFQAKMVRTKLEEELEVTRSALEKLDGILHEAARAGEDKTVLYIPKLKRIVDEAQGIEDIDSRPETRRLTEAQRDVSSDTKAMVV